MVAAEAMKGKVAFGSARIQFEVIFRSRKTLAITVYPDGKVVVTSPPGFFLAQITEKVKKKAAWILRQQDRFRRLESTTPPRRYVSGETHYYLGRQYRLKVIESAEKTVTMRSGFIEIYSPERSDSNTIQRQLSEWYREKAEEKIKQLFETCFNKIPALPIPREQLKFKLQRMLKRWGSCTASGHILLHPDLIKTPKACIEYIILHELAHLVVPRHNQTFCDLQARWMPDWQKWKERLERFERIG